jgi:hypothetical protein
MASAQPMRGEKGAMKGAASFYGFERIFGTGRRKTATKAKRA